VKPRVIENFVALTDVDAKYAACTFKPYPKAEVFEHCRDMKRVILAGHHALHQARAFLQYAKHFFTSVTLSEPAGMGYSSSMSAGK
jgi:hypothetical protein